MDRLTDQALTASMTTTTALPSATEVAASLARPTLDQVRRAIARRSFCTVATVSGRGRPHVAAVLYAAVGDDIWLNTLRSSRKGRNIADNPDVHVMVPVRRLPVGPPSAVHFAATARLLRHDDPEVVALAARGALKAITSHGELELAEGVFVKITPGPVWHTYGLGLSIIDLIRHPLEAGGRVVVGPDPG